MKHSLHVNERGAPRQYQPTLFIISHTCTRPPKGGRSTTHPKSAKIWGNPYGRIGLTLAVLTRPPPSNNTHQGNTTDYPSTWILNKMRQRRPTTFTYVCVCDLRNIFFFSKTSQAKRHSYQTRHKTQCPVEQDNPHAIDGCRLALPVPKSSLTQAAVA